jgi:Bacterial regulatory protein, Fis family
VALLGVSEPERLGREAFALLAETGVCVGIAVVVYSARAAPEILAYVGWDKARAGEVCVSIPEAIVRLGRCGDREFGLVVEPAEDPSSRNTVESVRKLIAASLALNQGCDRGPSFPWPDKMAPSPEDSFLVADADRTSTPEGPISRGESALLGEHSSLVDEVTVRMDQPLTQALAIVERAMVRRALERSHGRVEEAARLLGISRKGLFLKRRRWASDSRQAS